MARKRPFSLVYDANVREHLWSIDSNHYTLIRSTLERQLRFEPEKETRNRKPLARPITFRAKWELRFGPDNRFRAFYVVDHTRREVQILAIGIKQGDRLTVGGEDVEL